MHQYYNAEMKRIFMKKSRLIGTTIFLLLNLLIVYLMREHAPVNFLSGYKKFMEYYPVAFGVVELLAVFSDDFVAKSMQIAIGCGLGRNRVIFVKWLELVSFCVIDWLVIILMTVAGRGIFGMMLPGVVIKELVVACVHRILLTVTTMSFVMILVFLLQSVTFPMLVYIILALGALEGCLSLLAMKPSLARLHIERYTPIGLIRLSEARLAMGHFLPYIYLALAAYMAVGVVLTMVLFKKRELNF